MSRTQNKKPFPEKVKERVIVLAGEFAKPVQIADIIKEEFKKEETVSKCRNFMALVNGIIHSNKEYIFALKEQYSKAIMEVPIAHKRIRLERLESLYDEASKKPSERRELLKAAREELEGVRVNLNMYQMNFFGGISDAELAQREREIIDRIQSLAGGKGPEAEEKGISVLPAPPQAEVVSSV